MTGFSFKKILNLFLYAAAVFCLALAISLLIESEWTWGAAGLVSSVFYFLVGKYPWS